MPGWMGLGMLVVVNACVTAGLITLAWRLFGSVGFVRALLTSVAWAKASVSIRFYLWERRNPELPVEEVAERSATWN